MRLFRLLFCVLLLSLFCSISTFAGGFLRVTGKYISNNEGEIILRGLGLGGWLVPEGYMLQTPGYGSPTDIRNKISGLIGEANTDSFYTQYRKNFITRQDIDQIAAWGFNSIRLPMHYNLLTPKNQPGIYLESGFAIIDSLLSWCEANHLYLILDLHCAPGGQNSANISDYISGEPSLWESADNKTRTIALWKKIAERYATKEWIGGYDLLNETVWNFGGSNQPMYDLYVSITNAIRQVDTTHIVFIEGNQWANDFTSLGTPWDAKMVYSFHKYWNTNDLASIASYIALRSNSNRPLWLGESGENSNQWFSDCITLLENNKIGWSWWTMKKIESTSGMLSVIKNAEYDYLLKYWNGSVAKPTSDYAFSALLAQADRFKMPQCLPRPDVIDAMFRTPFSSALVPYAANNIPGRIPAVYYDYGKNNNAYRDIDYQAVAQGQGWNSGGVFRNDGVDIEKTSELYSGGYDVGWINVNEFLTFTINSQETATYSVDLRVASASTGGQILVQIDDTVSVGTANFTPSGGWQTWKSVSAGQCALTAGKHKMRLVFLTVGFNLAYTQFSKVTDVKDNHDQKITSYALTQNFPNPFNPTTTIHYQILEHGFVTLNVYDVLGKKVAALVNEEKKTGMYTVSFDGSKLTSGIYFYTLNTEKFRQTKKMMLLK